MTILYRYYLKQAGTSFSAPMVSATASLLLAKNPNLTNDEIWNILNSIAVDIYDEGWDGLTGSGILNAVAVLRADPKELLNFKITNVKIHNDQRDRLESVDVYGSVRGKFDHFVVEVAKGKHGKKFKQVAGLYNREANYDWICRIDKSDLRGRNDWILRMRITDQKGKDHLAMMDLDLSR